MRDSIRLKLYNITNITYIMNSDVCKNNLPITDWKKSGKTTAILFGRFQPLHKGHIYLINFILSSELDLHIFLNQKIDTEDERNPYSPEQRRKMIRKSLPNFPQENLHDVNVYLGGGGDIISDLEQLTKVFQETAQPKNTVIFYGRKGEDVKNYLVDGTKYKNIHYVDLLKQRGYDIQEVPIYNYLGNDTSANIFRRSRKKEILEKEVADYIIAQEILAERNNRTVGGDKTSDNPEVDGRIHDERLDLGKFQSLMLQERKRVLIPVEITPKR